MPKFICKCGYVMNLSDGWSDWELAIVPEKTIEDAGDLFKSDFLPKMDSFFKMIDEAKITAYRCPVCDRLYLENKEKTNKFTCYAPERFDAGG